MPVSAYQKRITPFLQTGPQDLPAKIISLKMYYRAPVAFFYFGTTHLINPDLTDLKSIVPVFDAV